MNNNQIYCANCGEVLLGEYCYRCGEKKLKKEDQTFKKFLEQVIDVFTHFNSKIPKSFYLLVAKPGFLTSEYLKGKHVRYAKPLQLFFIVNVLYFLLYIGFDTFTTPVTEHINRTFYSSLASKMVQEKIKKENITLEQYDEKFYIAVTIESKIFILVMIPLLALLYKLLYLRQGVYYYDHLIFSTYFFSFVLLYLTTFLNIFDFVSSSLFHYKFNFDTNPFISDILSNVITTIIFFIYLYIALKRVYKQSVPITIFKTFLSIVGLYCIIEIYRFILFFIVYYTT